MASKLLTKSANAKIVDSPGLTSLREKRISAEPLKGSATILLVEDVDNLRSLVGQMLRMQGYTVLESSNGAEALSVCKQQEGPIHLLLTDVVMPEISWQELVQHLVCQYPEIKVILMSGYAPNFILPQVMVDPSITFLQKPFKPKELTDKVKEVLNC